jgi:hypothetical protein
VTIKINHLGVLPDGTEIAIEEAVHSRFGARDSQDICNEIVRKSGLTTPRNDPQAVAVQLFRLEIAGAKIVQRLRGTYQVMPPRAAATADDYDTEMEQALCDLPDEFKSFVSSQAWQRGHSAGHDEVVGIANELAGDIRPAILAYQRRLMESLVGPQERGTTR